MERLVLLLFMIQQLRRPRMFRPLAKDMIKKGLYSWEIGIILPSAFFSNNTWVPFSIFPSLPRLFAPNLTSLLPSHDLSQRNLITQDLIPHGILPAWARNASRYLLINGLNTVNC